MEIREELPSDLAAVREVHRSAFATHPDQVVSLVDDLRRSLTPEPGLSLVAVDDGEHVVGHALLTRNLVDAPPRLVEIQVLSPLGVRPEAQGRGIGSALVRRGIAALTERGVPAIFLEGSPAYYSRFGFESAVDRGFRRPSLRIPKPAFQVLLLPAYEPWMTGTLVYRREFWDHDLVGLRTANVSDADTAIAMPASDTSNWGE
jgi:putative acetyltransferase